MMFAGKLKHCLSLYANFHSTHRSNFGLSQLRKLSTQPQTKQTLIEKIVQKCAHNETRKLRSGDYISVKPQHVMTHDNTSAVLKKFLNFFPAGQEKFFDPRQPVFTLDHNVQDKSEENLKKYKQIESFAQKHSIDFYPAGRGIGHQVMVEEGYAWPQTVAVASDSHSNMYGGVGCLGTPVVRTDAAAIWATGRTWWQVPPITKVELTGSLREGVTGKDVIITLCGLFNKDEVLNHAIEFCGSGVDSLSIDERLTIANMTTEWGALVGLFPVDEKTLQWYSQRAKHLEAVLSQANNKRTVHPRINEERIAELKRNVLEADNGAQYHQILSLDLSTVSPHISGPNHVKVMSSISEIEAKQIKINKAYIVSCVNSRVDDLAQAAKVLKGKKVADGVELYISAASSEVQQESERRGDWQELVAAGAKPLVSGCGPCIGLGVGLLQDGEVGISATNRNFKGRMGSRNAIAYLGSPAVVAASALKGYICAPTQIASVTPKASIKVLSAETDSVASAEETSIVSGFPSTVEGQLVFCHQDNLNTDGIYPGKYTYVDVAPEKQAQVVMENYDTEFGKLVNKGDIVIGGFNFGTGSSREQAATALKYKGIPLVLAGSFSETFKRNAINNGYLAIEVPKLVNELKERFGTGKLTQPTSLVAKIDFKKSTIEVDGKVYTISPTGRAAQELVVSGGLEEWVRVQLQ